MPTLQEQSIEMQIEVCREPMFHLKIRNFFPTNVNKDILDEAVRNKMTFNQAVTGKGEDLYYRSNISSYYDTVYIKDRNKSVLLFNLDKIFKDENFRQLLSSCPAPLSDFVLSTKHETQVSRYGVDNYYRWHMDRFENIERHFTIVYYFNTEPQKYSGGELQLTSSPVIDSKLIEENPEIVTIKPENNMAIIFGATIVHRVKQTQSPKEFRDGRFSANIWIGFK